MTLRIYRPAFEFDLSTVSVETGDYDLAEAGKIIGQPRVSRAAADLYRQAGSPPAIAFTCDLGHLKALAATFRISQIRAVEVGDHVDVETCRTRVTELSNGALDVLVTGRRLAGTSTIPKLSAILFLRPTLDEAQHAKFLARLDRSLPDLAIIDMVGGCDAHGLWLDAEPDVVVGAATDIIADPILERITDIPHKAALQWCGRNIARIELLQKAKNHKPGWAFHVIEATHGKAAAEQWWKQRGRQVMPLRAASITKDEDRF